MARLSISLPQELARAAAARAAAQKRSASSYVALLIEEDVKANSPVAATEIEEIQTAILEQPEVLPEIKRLIYDARLQRRLKS